MERPARRRHIAPAETRRKLIDATVACLVEFGYSGTTTQRVQTAAGVSRGALLHHFHTKADLFVGAIHHVAEVQAAHLRELAEQLPHRDDVAGDAGTDRIATAVDAVRQAMSGATFLAGVELWLAARTDESLRATLRPAERQVGKELEEIAQLLFGAPYASGPGFSIAFDSLLQLLRGLALTGVLRNNPLTEEQVIDAWVSAFPALCARDPSQNPARP